MGDIGAQGLNWFREALKFPFVMAFYNFFEVLCYYIYFLELVYFYYIIFIFIDFMSCWEELKFRGMNIFHYELLFYLTYSIAR